MTDKRDDWNDTLRKGGAEKVRERFDNVVRIAPEARPELIMSSRQFVEGYEAPMYLVEGIIQQRRLYSLTGKTGDGKTALQLYFAAVLASQSHMGVRDVERCRVLYLAGENPDDVRARWISMADKMNFDADTIDVYFIEGVFSVSGLIDRVRSEAEKIGGFGAVIVDTSAAYFEGDAENDNVQLGNHARLMRSLTEIAGRPAAIVGCHPIKSGESLLPRGGGAFLAEVDGNLTAKKVSDEIIELHWCGKYRGPNFEPVLFELVQTTSERVKDAKGRLVPSIMVRLTNDTILDGKEEQEADNEDQVLLLLDTTPGLSQAAMAQALGWLDAHGEPEKYRVNRCLAKLVRLKLADKDRRGKYRLTEKGKSDAKKLRRI
jgi:AAA domain